MRATTYVTRATSVCALVALFGCSGEAPGPSEPSTAPAATTAATTATPGDQSSAGGSQSHEGGADARPVARNANPREFGATCAADIDCDSGACFLGGHGGFCSQHCMSSTACPAGAGGSAPQCNPHGYCRY